MSKQDLPSGSSTSDIRQKFLSYFEQHEHRIVGSSSLVPGNDKTLLFTNAGMVQFKDVFTGEENRDYKRATTSQRCVRAGGKHNDLDNVGYTARHHTFFEMLGNFSFGDYFKENAILFAWEFLTRELGLPAEKLWVTVFEEDDEAFDLWIDKIGVPAERVIRIGAKDNFWAMGDTGPCGPCSEIFYDHGPDVAGGPPGSPEEDGDRYIEIWNLVFMQFDRASDGTMNPLPMPSVDTGMGLERIAAVLQGVHSNYEIDLFDNLIRSTARLLGTSDLANDSLKVIADHIRSCAFLIADGVVPSNEGRGYVLRRIIRRAARHGNKLGADEPFFHKLVKPLATEMGAAYPELHTLMAKIEKELLLEEQRFNDTLSGGMKILEAELSEQGESANEIPGDVVFKLYDTYGFPVDLTADIARERGLGIDQGGFDAAMEAQRARARAASNFGGNEPVKLDTSSETTFLGYTEVTADSTVQGLFIDGKAASTISVGQCAILVLDETPFYAESGGQVGDIGIIKSGTTSFVVADTRKQGKTFLHFGELSAAGGDTSLRVGDKVTATVDSERRQDIALNHSATHLMHGALRSVLGEHVEQKGSLVNEERLRFDFSHGAPVNESELQDVERWVNDQIRLNGVTEIREMSMDHALEAGAMALFGEKYGDVVRVVSIGDESTELCGGIHVKAAGDIGAFRIAVETGVAAGVRRIEAFSGAAALDYTARDQQSLQRMATLLKSNSQNVEEKVTQLWEKNRELSREVERLKGKLSSQAGSQLTDSVLDVAGIKVVLQRVEDGDAKVLRGMVDQLKQSLGEAAIVLATENKGKAILIAGVTKPLNKKLKAGQLINEVASIMGGRGGGRDDMAQAGADNLDKLDAAFEKIPQWIEQTLDSTTAS